MALALAAGASFYEAARLANYAGGLVVMKRGTATVSARELRRRRSTAITSTDRELVPGGTRPGQATDVARRPVQHETAFMGRVLTEAELVGAVARDRAAGRTIAFANGCFDLLHVGHVRYLQGAAAEADRLVVAINDDRVGERR